MDALTLDYSFLSAFSGLEGDYSKAANALHSLAGWDPHTVMVQWAFAYALAPACAFAIAFWGARAVHLRRLPAGHAVRMLCNLDWSAAALRGRSASSRGGEQGFEPAMPSKPATSHIKVPIRCLCTCTRSRLCCPILSAAAAALWLRLCTGMTVT